MVIPSFGRVRQSLVSAAGVAHEHGKPSFRTVMVWKHSFGDRFGVSEFRFCWPSLQAFRAETMFGGVNHGSPYLFFWFYHLFVLFFCCFSFFRFLCLVFFLVLS